MTGNADAKTRAAAIHALTEMGERGACFDDEARVVCATAATPNRNNEREREREKERESVSNTCLNVWSVGICQYNFRWSLLGGSHYILVR